MEKIILKQGELFETSEGTKILPLTVDGDCSVKFELIKFKEVKNKNYVGELRILLLGDKLIFENLPIFNGSYGPFISLPQKKEIVNGVIAYKPKAFLNIELNKDLMFHFSSIKV